MRSSLPLHTRRFNNVNEDDLDDIDLIVTCENSTENRGQLPLWSKLSAERQKRLLRLRLVRQNHVIAYGEHLVHEVCIDLQDTKKISEYLGEGPILVDISGLPHGVWAPLIRAAYHSNLHIYVLYAEPNTYKVHPTPASSSYFDLSVTFEGLAPLPGFAKLSGPPDENKCIFIALLGFEGNRPSYLSMQVDPLPKVIPFVGVPGFQIEYPTYTVVCNREFLNQNSCYEEIRLARASCPFDVIFHLNEIHKDYPDHYLYIAPVGTKPHALGGIMYSLMNPSFTEVMYDHPVRKAGRTSGVGKIHIYDFGVLGRD